MASDGPSGSSRCSECVNKKEPVEDPNRPILIRPTLPLAIPA